MINKGDVLAALEYSRRYCEDLPSLEKELETIDVDLLNDINVAKIEYEFLFE